MNRVIIILGGLALAFLYAALMYGVFGDLNWNSSAEQRLPWFEPGFWLLAGSGFGLLLLAELGCWVRRLIGEAPCPH